MEYNRYKIVVVKQKNNPKKNYLKMELFSETVYIGHL